MLVNQEPSDVDLLDGVSHPVRRVGEVPVVVERVSSIFWAHDVRAPKEPTNAPFSQPRDVDLTSYSAVEVDLVHLVAKVRPGEDGQVDVAICGGDGQRACFGLPSSLTNDG